MYGIEAYYLQEQSARRTRTMMMSMNTNQEYQGQIYLAPSVNMENDVTKKETRQTAGTVPVGSINSIEIEGVNALGQAEMGVMDAIWQLGASVTVNQIRDRVEMMVRKSTPAGEKPKKVPYTTVLAAVVRLSRKGFLLIDKNPPEGEPNAYYYTPSISKEEYRGHMARALIKEGFRISASDAMDTVSEMRTVKES